MLGEAIDLYILVKLAQFAAMRHGTQPVPSSSGGYVYQTMRGELVPEIWRAKTDW
jgi:hypothetical protein